MTIPASSIATYEAAQKHLSAVFTKLRSETHVKDMGTLKRWCEVLSGWLPTLGELASGVGGQAREAKQEAVNRRAALYADALLHEIPQRTAQATAQGDMRVQDLLKDWAVMKGWADKMYALREDCLEALNGVKKSIEAEKTLRGI